MRVTNLRIDPKKCQFHKYVVRILRHVIKAIMEYQRPNGTTERKVKQFLSFTGYYWKFIERYLNTALLLL
jgi:hypothetical protein